MSKKNIDKRLEAIEEHLGLNTLKTTRILVVQDKSGSMYGRRDETISGFNEYLEDVQRDKSDQAFLTLIQFDTTSTIIHEGKPVEDVPKLNASTYVPGGGTALLDAVGRGLDSLEREMQEGDRALVIIMTDGLENSSRQHTSSKVQRQIGRLEEKDNYTFVFLGAGHDSWHGGELLGLRREQSVYYGADSHSHGIAYAGLSNATANLRSGTQMSNAAFGAATTGVMAEKGASVETEGFDPVTGLVKININAEGITTGKETEEEPPAGAGG